MSSLISVIMSVYNEKPQWLKESIESILNQTYKNIEFIIIIDNPLNKKAIDLINNYALKDKRVKLFINDKNMGLVYSLNLGLKNANGDYIARMDADDISHLNRLEKQLKYIKEENLDLIGSNINLFNENGVFFTTDKLLTHKYIKKLLAKGTIGIVHPTFFAKRELFDKLGAYANSLHTEDKELLARAICNNFRVGNIKDILLNCRYNNQSITKTNAIYVDRVGRYITKVFKDCLMSGKYNFDEKYIKELKVSKKEIENYNKKQLLINEAKAQLNQKNYLKFIYLLLKAIISSKTVFSTIKVNIYLKIYRVLEQIEMRRSI